MASKLIDQIANEVRAKFEGEGTGHDWWHIKRVWNCSKHIASKDGLDMEVVELSALLHDIDDWKFNGGDDKAGSKAARELLEKYGAEETIIVKVCDIIDRVSYKGAGVADEMPTLEGKCVQDADRLDAMGAIGVARAFTYGGHKGNQLYHPDIKPVMHETKQAYISSDGTTLNHFYEKLLLLKDRMHTETGKKLAEERHAFMQEYVHRFIGEWEGKE